MNHEPLESASFPGSRRPAAGLIGLASWASRARSAEVDPTALEEKAVGFLRPRQAADGSWSGDRKEPGITALVVTALLRIEAGHPGRPGDRQGARLPGGVRRPQGRARQGPALGLLHLGRPHGLPGGQPGRALRRPHQGGPGIPQGQPDRRGRGEDPGRPRLRRLELRRRCRPPRPLEHLVHDGGPPATPASPPTTRRSRRRWSSCRGARTSRASSTTSPGPARSTTAASSTWPPAGARGRGQGRQEARRPHPLQRRDDLRRASRA